MGAKKRKTKSAEEWAKEHYGDWRLSATADKTMHAAYSKAGKSKQARAGLPKKFPAPLISAERWSNEKVCRDRAESSYRDGYGAALLKYCLWHWEYARLNRSNVTVTDQIRAQMNTLAAALPRSKEIAEKVRKLTLKLDDERFEAPDEELPFWAQDALAGAFREWLGGRVGSIDRALGLKARHGMVARREADWGHAIIEEIAAASGAGVQIGEELFHAVGWRYRKSAKTIERIYRSMPHRS